MPSQLQRPSLGSGPEVIVRSGLFVLQEEGHRGLSSRWQTCGRGSFSGVANLLPSLRPKATVFSLPTRFKRSWIWSPPAWPSLFTEGKTCGTGTRHCRPCLCGLTQPYADFPCFPRPPPGFTEMYFPCSFTLLAPLGQNEWIRGQSRLSVIHPLVTGARHKAAAILEA